MSDWIEWHGGGRPVPPGTMIEVRLRNGVTLSTRAPNWAACWRNDEAPDDIVAYRVVSEAPKPDQPDMVNNPPHYTDGGIETIDYLEAKLGPDGFRAFCIGNALKYVSRAGKKADLKQDLSKAILLRYFLVDPYHISEEEILVKFLF